MSKFFFSIFFFFVLISLTFTATNISSCTTISSAGDYVLNASIVSDGTNCIEITSNDVNLNLAGYSVSNVTNTGTAPIVINGVNSNVSVYDGTVHTGKYGISAVSSLNVNITNITSFGNTFYGIFFANTSYSNITNITSRDNTEDGIKFQSGSGGPNNFNRITDFSSYNNSESGVDFQSSNNNTVSEGLMYSNIEDVVISENSTYNVIGNSIMGQGSDGVITIEGDDINTNNLIENISVNGYISSTAISISDEHNSLNNATIGNATTAAILVSTTHNVSLSNLTIFNVSFGIYIVNSNESNVSSSTIYNNSQPGVSIVRSSPSGSMNNRIFSNTIENNSGPGNIWLFNLTSINHLYNNPSIRGNTYSVLINISNYTNITNNTIYNTTIISTASTVYCLDSHFNNITNNTLHSSLYGLHLQSSNLNIITQNTVYSMLNESFRIDSSNSNNLTSNTAYNGDLSAFYLRNGSSNNTLTSNTAFNITDSDAIAFVLESSPNTLNSNTVYDSPLGFGVTSGSNSTFINNTAYSITGSVGFIFSSSGVNIVNNTIYDASENGFVFVSGSVSNFSGNNATNTTNGINISSGASLTFNGNNELNSIPNSGYSILIESGNISTSNYNVTNDNLNFALNTTSNVSIKLSNLSSFNSVSSINDSSSNSISYRSSKVLQSYLGNYYALNVTNTSVSSLFAPIIYFNTSDQTSDSNLGIGSTSSTGSWIFYNASMSQNSLTNRSISNYSLFAPLEFTNASSSTLITSSDSSDSKKSMIITYSLSGENLEIRIVNSKSKEELESVLVKVFSTSFGGYSSSKLTDEFGLSVFTISKDGQYKIVAKLDGYHTQELLIILALDGSSSQETSEELEEAEDEDPFNPSEIKEEPIEEIEEENDYEKLASDSIKEAENLIFLAQKEGKDVSNALKILNQAKEEFEDGNYNLTIELSELSINEIIDTNSGTIQKDAPQEETIDREEFQNLDFLWFICPILIIISIILFFVFKKNKKKKKE